MRMTFLRKALLIWMVAWLPFAGAVAAVMPITGTSAASAFTATPMIDVVAASQSESSSDEFSMPCHGKAANGKSTLGQTCTHCVLCHLAGALALGSMPVMPQLAPPIFLMPARCYRIHRSFLIFPARRRAPPSPKREGLC
jgi:hypothetical protein